MKIIELFKVNFYNFKSFVFLLILIFNYTLFCQTPNLGEANLFAIYSATGAIDNVGSTIITGDVGTNTGAFNGFPPGTIDGNIHISDAVSTQVAIDVDELYSFFSSLACDSTISNTIGNNQSLTPNVYCINAASYLEDTLILDGQNNSNSQFIFKINGAFTTSVYSTLLLVNQAQAKNIFWQINGLFNLGEFSHFKGTIITDGAINLLANSSFEGRVLSRAGAISLLNNIVVMNFNNISLPIELISFSVECFQENGIAKWSTASESENDYFTIEKSGDLENWQEIATINGAGNSTSLINYTFEIDYPLNEKSGYYRLKQTDFNGQFSYSNNLFFQFCNDSKVDLTLIPNPANDKFQFNYDESLEKLDSIVIYSFSGEKSLLIEKNTNEIDISKLKSGIYIVFFKFENESIIKRLIVTN